VRGSRLRNATVISQVTVSLVLIIGAATLVRNGSAVRNIDVGFETPPLVSITPRGATAKSDGFTRAYDALASSPHVSQVAATSHNPLTGELPISPIRMPLGRSMVLVSYMYVSPEYFSTLQIPLDRGRGFAADEARHESKVAIVSAAAARVLWPDTDSLGKTVRVWIAPEERPDVMTHDRRVATTQIDNQGEDMVVIGVAKDVVSGLVYDGRRPHMYLPTSPGARHAKALLVRGRSIADSREDLLRSTLRAVDSNPLAFSILSLDEALALQTYPMVIASWVGLLLSGIALSLSVSGLYGVVRYGLSQRVKEIGIRIALGAPPAAIIRLVMMHAARLVAIGSGVGLLVSFSALGILAAIVPLQNVSILNPAAFSVGTALVAMASALAALFPSRKAIRVDPSHSLRADQ
jgi:putative ABC transport system permease protein